MNPYAMQGMDPDAYTRGRQALLSRMKDPNVAQTPEAAAGMPNTWATIGKPTGGPVVAGPWTGGITGTAKDPREGMPAPSAKSYGVTSGYDTGKLNDAAYHSPKYDLGRITNDIGLQRLMTPEGQSELQKQLAANPFYKDVRVNGDKVMYTGQQGQPVTIDYIQGMNSGHPNLNYLTSDHGGAPAGGGTLPISTASPAAPSAGAPVMDDAFWQKIMESLQNGGQTLTGMDPSQREALLKLLQQPEDPNAIHMMGAV